MSWVVEWASGTPHSTMMNKQNEIVIKKASLIKIAIDVPPEELSGGEAD